MRTAFRSLGLSHLTYSLLCLLTSLAKCFAFSLGSPLQVSNESTLKLKMSMYRIYLRSSSDYTAPSDLLLSSCMVTLIDSLRNWFCKSSFKKFIVSGFSIYSRNTYSTISFNFSSLDSSDDFFCLQVLVSRVPNRKTLRIGLFLSKI